MWWNMDEKIWAQRGFSPQPKNVFCQEFYIHPDRTETLLILSDLIVNVGTFQEDKFKINPLNPQSLVSLS